MPTVGRRRSGISAAASTRAAEGSQRNVWGRSGPALPPRPSACADSVERLSTGELRRHFPCLVARFTESELTAFRAGE
jgi:hypothetical protein